MKISHNYGFILVALCMTTIGCGSSPVSGEGVKVRGNVTLDGHSLALGTVTYIHETGFATTADIKEDGGYEIEAKPGVNRIAVIARLPDVENPGKRPSILPGTSLTPARYEDPATSGLQLRIADASSELQMDLELHSSNSQK